MSRPWERAAAITQPADSAPPPPSGTQQIGGGMVAAASNGLTMGAVGPEIPPITIGINAIVERLKRWEKFDEAYAFHYMAMLWLLVAVVWGFLKGDPTHSILMFFGGIGNSHFTHEGIKATDTIIKPIPEEKRYVPTDAVMVRRVVFGILVAVLFLIAGVLLFLWKVLT